MKREINSIALLVASGLILHVACDKAETVRNRSDAQRAAARGAAREQNQEQAVPKTDIAVLERFINLPYAPMQVKWNTSNQPGGNDWSLRALLFLKPDDMQSCWSAPNGCPASAPRCLAMICRTGFHPRSGALFAAADKSPAIHGDALVFEKYGLVYLVLFTM